MHGNLNGVRALIEQRADLAGAEVGTVAQCEQLTVALVESAKRAMQVESSCGGRLEIARSRDVGRLSRRRRPRREVRIDRAARDTDQPRGWLALPAIVACAVPKRALEHVGGNVLSVGAVPDPIGHIRVHAPDQGLGMSERVTRAGHQPYSR